MAEDKARDRVDSGDSARECNAVIRPREPAVARMGFFNGLFEEVEDSARARNQGTSNGTRSLFSLGIRNSLGSGYRSSKPGETAGLFCALTREYIIEVFIIIE